MRLKLLSLKTAGPATLSLKNQGMSTPPPFIHETEPKKQQIRNIPQKTTTPIKLYFDLVCQS
jgi:hypothetical protein